MAFCAQFIVLLSIFAGKVLAIKFGLPDEAKQVAREQLLSQDRYQSQMKSAEKFANLKSEAEYPTFMVDESFSDKPTAKEITPDEVADFKNSGIPQLKRLQERRPTYEQWKAWQAAKVDKMAEEFATSFPQPTLPEMIDIAKDDLDLIDLLFGFFGVATAYKLGAGQTAKKT